MKKTITHLTVLAAILTGVQALAQQPYQPANYVPGIPINSVKVLEPSAPYTDPMDVLSANRTVEEVKRTTQYFDGLGRPIQTVSWQSTPLKKDMVAAKVYDALGREAHQFLPYVQQGTNAADGQFKYDAFGQQQAFNAAQFGPQGETFFYGQTEFEPSPLNRPVKAMPPGNSWAGNGRGVQQQYQLNDATVDAVRIWTVGDGPGDLPQSPGAYATGELYKNVTIDERNARVIEYKNKEGLVVLKKVQAAGIAPNGHHGAWLCTYYVYDDFNRLRFVIQPRAVLLLNSNGWNFANTPDGAAVLRDEQCFQYRYDDEGRMAVKKVPGAGEVRMVYDNRDRLVMTQDANMRNDGKWLVMHYDGLNRLVQTGLWQSGLTHAQHQAAALASTTDYPFASTATPTGGYELLTQTGYDTYATLPTASGLTGTLATAPITTANFVTNYNTAPLYAQPITATTAVKGLPTWTMAKVLDGAATPTYLYTVTFYDDKGRAVQVQSKNLSGGTDIATTQYDFSGKAIRTHQQHQRNATATPVTVLTKQVYDHAGRLLELKKQVGSGSFAGQEKTTVRHEYNELGQLKKKTLAPGGPAMVNGLETLAYDYNIRGWMLGANRDYIKGLSNNYFGFELAYDKQAAAFPGQSFAGLQHNGNINSTLWKAKGDGEVRRYDFSYDRANRLTFANFNQLTGGSFNKTAGINYTVEGLSYDQNGNILAMSQYGWKPGAGSNYIDQLTYTYFPGSNRLRQVTDGSNDNTSKLGDFKYDAASKTATDYAYDDNGNLTIDRNKGMEGASANTAGIAYNHLNLPRAISVKGNPQQVGGMRGSIEYVYDAGGNKLKKTVKETGKPDKVTEYIGGFVYEDGALQLLGHEEGRIRPVMTGGQLTDMVFDYFLKDHLGNVRTVITEEQRVDKYPVASLEPAKLATEQNYYEVNTAQIVDGGTVSGLPAYGNDNGIGNNPEDAGFAAANSTRLYRLNGGGGAKTGLGMVLKVMSGDKVDILGRSFYSQPVTNNGTCGDCGLTAANILAAFIGSPTAAGSTGAHGALTPMVLEGTAGPGIVNILQSGQNTQATGNPSKPKAFINYILLDEQFKYAGGGASMVGSLNELKQHFNDLQHIAVSKNGYLYVYCSNESNMDVYFDNIQLVHTRGPLLEETQYYPFGLVMGGLSSRAAGRLENKKKYQGYEHNTVFDLNTYEAFYRTHDPQIGRWWQIDPKPESGLAISPYAAMNDNPISGIDILGDVVEYERGEGVSRKEFRQFKREIRDMRRNSESFRAMYNGFKKDSRTFKYVATNSSSGGVTNKTDKGYDMRISIHGKDPNQAGNEKFSTIGQVAHETGHAFRKSNNLDPAIPGRPDIKFGMDINQTTAAINANTKQLVNYNNTSELGASHIENIVLGELIQSSNQNYKGLQISATYYGGTVSKTVYKSNAPPMNVPDLGNLDKLVPPRTREYYLNTKFNIYAEHGLQEPDK